MRAKTCAALALIALWACGSEEATHTEVAVSNGGTASIDATISDGETDVTFENVAAGTTTSYKPASFGSLSALTVTVGDQTSDADLTAGRRNTVNIGADGKVTGVVAQAATSGSGDGW